MRYRRTRRGHVSSVAIPEDFQFWDVFISRQCCEREYPLHTRPVNNVLDFFNLANISTGRRMIARRPPWRN